MPTRDRTDLGARSRPLVWLDDRPVLTNALRAAVAAALAWALARELPAPANEYPYYAPMGAVLAATTNPRGSLTIGLQAAGAILLGGLIAIGVDIVGNAWAAPVLAVGVLVAMLFSRVSWLGEMGAFVPSSTIFCLLIGTGSPFYLSMYTGTVLLGAIVSVAVAVLAPGQPLVQVGHRLDRVREAMHARVMDCITVFEAEDGAKSLGPDDHGLSRALHQARSSVTEAAKALDGNRRVRRHHDHLHMAQEQLAAWEHVASMLEIVIAQGTSPDTDHPGTGRRLSALDPQVATPAAKVLRRLAEVLATTRARPDDAATDACAEAVVELEQLLDEHSIPYSPSATMVAVSVRSALEELRGRRSAAYPASELST